VIEEAVILASGKATRMNGTFKWLTPIGEEMTIARYQIKWLLAQGIKRIYVTVNAEHPPITDPFVASLLGRYVELVVESNPTGDEPSAKKALACTTTDCLPVINGDVITDLNLARMPRAPSIMLVHPRSPWGVFHEDGDYKIIEEKPVLPIWVSGGIYCFTREHGDEMTDEGSLAQNIVPAMLKKRRMAVYKHTGLWHAVENWKDAEEARKILARATKQDPGRTAVMTALPH